MPGRTRGFAAMQGGTIGAAARGSHAPKTAKTATPPATQTAATGDCHPASAESTNPKVSSSRPQLLSATPATSKERGTGSRDSVTATRQMTTVITPIGTLTQKIDDQGNTLSSKPPSTLPPATARPLTAAHSRIGPVLASGG
jgi:hypothetical protein